MKPNLSFASILTAGSLRVSGPALRASETDDRIEASAKKSYVSKTYHAEDSAKTGSKDGMVTLSGTVSQASHQALAQDTVSDIAKNAAEKSPVTKLASDGGGVVDEMTIDITAASAR